MKRHQILLFLLALNLCFSLPSVKTEQNMLAIYSSNAIASPLPTQHAPKPTDLKTLQNAYQNGQSNLQVLQTGTVIKLLSDDNQGSRHQRFLVKLASGQVLLIAHNIDLAPRLAELQVGDKVRFYGEYEWNDKGGVIHWTHRDPQRRHIDGWLEYNGRRYQ